MNRDIHIIRKVRTNRVVARFSKGITCRSALVVKKKLLVLQLDKDCAFHKDFFNIVVYNLRTGKQITSWRDKAYEMFDNARNLSLLAVGSSESHLVVCTDFNITILEVEKAFKIWRKFSWVEASKIPVNYNRSYNKLASPVRALNHQELLIIQKNLLWKWNFCNQQDTCQTPPLYNFGHLAEIHDFQCVSQKNLLLVLEADNFKIFDLTNFNLLSSYDLDNKKSASIWKTDIERGWISIIEYDYIYPSEHQSIISTLKLDSSYKLKEVSKFIVKGQAVSYFKNSNELSCLTIILDPSESIWALFDYQNHDSSELAQHETHTLKNNSRTLLVSDGFKIIEYLDNTGLLLGAHKEKIILTTKHSMFKNLEEFTLQKFLEFVDNRSMF